MPRARTVPDGDIFAVVRNLMADGGERAATFSAVAAATGLSGASLVQRYVNRNGMVQAALADGWAILDGAAREADANIGPGPAGAATLLKRLGAEACGVDIALLAGRIGDPDLAAKAADWQCRIETALARRLGTDRAPDLDGARILFAAWQGRLLWAETGRDGARLKHAAQRLSTVVGGKKSKTSSKKSKRKKRDITPTPDATAGTVPAV